jgi:hypothetical protein
MNNLSIYNKVRSVPDEALKTIQAGRLKGKSDINPMWRIKTLTELFGPCGIGWKYRIIDKRLEVGGSNEISAFVDIDLFYKFEGEWSEAVQGTGGSSFVANESKGPYMSDECFKMALTDAISVACKAIGIGADVYWEADKTKYQKLGDEPDQKPTTTKPTLSEAQIKRAYAIGKSKGIEAQQVKEWIMKYFKKSTLESLTKTEYDTLCNALEKKVKDVPEANV